MDISHWVKAQGCHVPRGTKTVNIYADHLDLSLIEFEKPEEVETLNIVALHVSVSRSSPSNWTHTSTLPQPSGFVNLPGKSLRILAGTMTAADEWLALGSTRRGFDYARYAMLDCFVKKVSVQDKGTEVVTSTATKVESLPDDYTLVRGDMDYGWVRQKSTRQIFNWARIARKRGTKVPTDIFALTPVHPAFLAPDLLLPLAKLVLPAVLTARILLDVPAAGEDARQGVLALMRWIAAAIPEDSSDAAVAILREAVAATAREAQLRLRRPSYLPLLERKVFEARVRDLLSGMDALKTEAHITSSTTTLYQALQNLSAHLDQNQAALRQFVSSVRSREAKLDETHSGFVSDLSKQLKTVDQGIERCNGQVKKWKAEYETRLDAYKSAVKAEAWKAAVLAVLEVGLAIGATIATAGAAAPTLLIAGTAVGEIAQATTKFQKIMQIAELVYKLYQAFDKIKNQTWSVSETVSELGPLEADWQEATNEFNASMPADAAKDERALVVAGFANMCEWGKQNIRLLGERVLLTREIALNKGLARASGEQVKALSEMKTTSVDLAKIDWSGLQYDVEILEKRMLGRLVKVYALLDATHQYKFHVPATPLDALTVFDIRMKLDSMWDRIQSAKVAQRFDATPIVFRGVPVADITGGKSRIFKITPEEHLEKHFRNQSHVRVREVQIALEAEGGAALGPRASGPEYVIRWYVPGDGMIDVTDDNRHLTFSTDAIEGTSRYKCEGNQLVEPAPSDDKRIARLSPFTAWEVSIPEKVKDKPTQFELFTDSNRKTLAERVNIVFKFKYEAVD